MRKAVLLLGGILHLCLGSLSGAVNWTLPATQISSSGIDASTPQIGVSSSGYTVAVWEENNLIKSSNLPFNGTWSASTTLSGSGASNIVLVVDANGNATAIWLENGIVMASSQPLNGTWSGKVTLSGSGASTPSLAVDTSGNVVAVWARNGYIESSTLLFGGSWGDGPAVISERVADSPQVAIGANGNVVAVWHSVVSSTDTILAANASIGGTWNAPSTISSTGVNSVQPKVAVDVSGDAVVSWFTYTLSGVIYTDVIFQTVSQPYGGAWGTPVNVSVQAGTVNPALLNSNLAVDGNKNTVATWTTSSDGSNYSYFVAIKPANGPWSYPQNFLGNNLYLYSYALAVEPKGHAQMAFLYYNNLGQLEILANEIDIFAQLPGISPVTILSTGGNNNFAQIAVNSDTSNIYTAAAWINYQGTNLVVEAATGLGAIYPPPTNLTVTQSSNDFIVFTEYFNTINWTASADPTTYEYLIYRNGNFVEAVSSATQLQFVDHNQVQNGSVTYGVAAVNTYNAQSTIATVSFP